MDERRAFIALLFYLHIVFFLVRLIFYKDVQNQTMRDDRRLYKTLVGEREYDMKGTTNFERLNYIPGWENFFTFKPKGDKMIRIQLFNFTFEELEEGIFSNIEKSIFKNEKIKKSVANIVAALIAHAIEHEYIHSLMRMDDYARVPDNVHGFLVDFIWACAYIRNPKDSKLKERVIAKRLLKHMAACATFDEMLESCGFNNDLVDRPDHFDQSFFDILRRRKHV